MPMAGFILSEPDRHVRLLKGDQELGKCVLIIRPLAESFKN